MAINQSEVATQACANIVLHASKLYNEVVVLETIKDLLTGAGINLADFVTQIEADQRIRHCDAATYKNIVDYFIPDVITALKADYTGSPTQQAWSGIMKARLT